MSPNCLKNLSTSDIERKIYIYMLNEAFDELPEWLQKGELLLSYIETLPKQQRKNALIKAANIIMSEHILNIEREKINSGERINNYLK